MLSPTKTVVLSPSGKVYETPSTDRESLVAFRSNSVRPVSTEEEPEKKKKETKRRNLKGKLDEFI